MIEADDIARALHSWRLPRDPSALRALGRALGRALAARRTERQPDVALAELGELGAALRAWEDRISRQRHSQPDGARDAECAKLWRGWIDGDLRHVWAAWEDRYLPVAERVFRARFQAAGVPRSTVEHEMHELRRAFIFKMVGQEGDVIGWRELLLRVVETGPAGPVAELLPMVPSSGWPRIAAALAAAPRTRRSVAVWLGGVSGELACAINLADRLAKKPEGLLDLLDLHLLLLAARDGRAGTEAEVALLMRLRWATGRLRAAACALAEPGALREALARSLSGLERRTQAAVGRYAWSWAMDELRRGGYLSEHGADDPPTLPISARNARHRRPVDGSPWDDRRAVTRPCSLPLPPGQPFAPDQERLASVWACLFVLRLGIRRLDAWVRTRASDGRSSRLGELQKLVPEELTDGSNGASRGYERLRALLLRVSLPRLLSRWSVTFDELSGWPERDRRNPSRLRALLETEWPPALIPKGGVPAMIRNAAEARAWLKEREGSP